MTDLCPYFGKCGGCIYQDMPTNDYLDMKKRYVMRCFSDYGLTPVIEDIISIPIHSRRRACFAFHKGHLGFNENKSHTIIDIEECRLLTDNLCHILSPLRTFIKSLGGSGDVFVLDTPYGIDMHIKTKSMINIIPILLCSIRIPPNVACTQNQRFLVVKTNKSSSSYTLS